jgi:long-subunit acyl-CoA synthetase (AMP-forming)
MQIFVTGDGYKTYLVAILIPRQDTLTKWAEAKGTKICVIYQDYIVLMRSYAKIMI